MNHKTHQSTLICKLFTVNCMTLLNIITIVPIIKKKLLFIVLLLFIISIKKINKKYPFRYVVCAENTVDEI